MNKVYFICTILLLCFMSCKPTDKDEEEVTEEYIQTLYNLGSVAVTELDQKFWGDEEGQTAYLKGERVDVNGWLSPYWVKTNIFLTDSVKEEYGIPKEPLTYSEYISLLDVDTYKKTENPLTGSYFSQNLSIETQCSLFPLDLVWNKLLHNHTESNM